MTAAPDPEDNIDLLYKTKPIPDDEDALPPPPEARKLYQSHQRAADDVDDVEITDEEVEAAERDIEAEKAARDKKRLDAEREDQADDDDEDEGAEEDAGDDEPLGIDQPKQPVDPGALSAFARVANELGIDAKLAQQVVNSMAPHLHDLQRANEQRVNEQWQKEARADKELNAGQGFKANLALARGCLKSHGDAELRSLLEKSPLGSHPAVLRFMARVGRTLTARTVAGRATPPATERQPDAIDDEALAGRLYGKTPRRDPVAG